MRFFIITYLFIALIAEGVRAQPRLDLKSSEIKSDLFAKILNLSEMKALRPPSQTDASFYLRLYSLDDISNNEEDSLEYCTPEVETEVICGYRYFLAVHDGGLGDAGKVYDLGKVGEIAKIEWQKRSKSNVDRLRLEVLNYPAHAFKLNPTLVKRTKKFELIVTLDSLEVKELK